MPEVFILFCKRMAQLRDGSEVRIRELTPRDAPVLAEAFERLSPESRDLRFLSAKPRLTSHDLEYLTDVDGHLHEALGAVDVASSFVASLPHQMQGGKSVRTSLIE